MPPQRTTPPTKAVKTERTHEENQERAYIAASRRGDRSLEARIESARRASEIHKKRTGRALRVTEQDVVNEEMYSEEDDEYPPAYRGLTQHLRSGSTDWNRRLNAYLTQHVAMRSALDQALVFSRSSPYSQNTIYTSGFLPQHPQMIQQPQLTPQQPLVHSHMIHSQSVPAPQVQTSHVSLRQQPYPSPNSGRHHGRSMQIHIPQPQQGVQVAQYQQESANTCRSSIATPNISSSLSQAPVQPITRRMSSPTNPPQVSAAQLTSPQTTPQQPQNHVLQPTFEQTTSPDTPQTPYIPPNDCLFEFPLTTQLPPETQQFLQPALDPNDSMYPALMGNYPSPGFGFDNDAAGLKSVSPDTTSPAYSLFDFDLCGTSINPFSLCGGPNFESQYCSPDSAAQQIMSTPLKSSPVSPLGSEEGLSLADGAWYQYLNIDNVTKTS